MTIYRTEKEQEVCMEDPWIVAKALCQEFFRKDLDPNVIFGAMCYIISGLLCRNTEEEIDYILRELKHMCLIEKEHYKILFPQKNEQEKEG